jgi:peptidoglycan/LPS O-acetylase OafA/YrhL
MKRLYPLVFLGTSFGIILAIIAAVFKHDITFEQIMLAGALGLLLLPSFVFPRWETAYPFNMASWSLTFELFVNAIYGIIAPRLGPRWLLALVAASGGVLVWVAFANHGIGGGNNQKGFAWGFGRVLFPFFAGVALYRHRIKRALHPVVGIAMCVALPLFLLLPGPRSPITSLLFVFVIFPIIVASGAAVNVGGTPNAICRVFGMLSYPVYILQGPVLRVGEEVLKHRPLDLTGEWTFGLAEACVVLLVAWFASRFYDEPLQRLFRGRAPINFRKEAEQPNAA